MMHNEQDACHDWILRGLITVYSMATIDYVEEPIDII